MGLGELSFPRRSGFRRMGSRFSIGIASEHAEVIAHYLIDAISHGVRNTERNVQGAGLHRLPSAVGAAQGICPENTKVPLRSSDCVNASRGSKPEVAHSQVNSATAENK
jgi:hypothetical protein